MLTPCLLTKLGYTHRQATRSSAREELHYVTLINPKPPVASYTEEHYHNFIASLTNPHDTDASDSVLRRLCRRYRRRGRLIAEGETAWCLVLH